MKAGEKMKKKILRLLALPFSLFILSVAIYWFNLDTKLVKLLEKPMMKHYDGLQRDKRI